MRILITGATGFIGQLLVKSLRSDHELILVSRQPKLAAKQLSVDNLKVIHINNLKNLNNVDVIINLAGESLAAKRWSEQQKRVISESRWLITEKLLSALKASDEKQRVWINASAIGYYGAQNAEPLSESFEPSTRDFPARVCYHWEELARQAQQYYCRVCIIRLGVVLGSSGGMLEKLIPIYHLGLGSRLGTGQQMLSWITRDDVVHIIQFLIQNNECKGVYNATTPHPVTQQQFSETLARLLYRPHLFRTPGWILKILLGEMATLMLDGQNIQPARLQLAGYSFRYPEIHEALRHCIEDC